MVVSEQVSICVFAVRESMYSLSRTIAAALVAAPKKSVIDVIVNGNPRLAQDAAMHIKSLGLEADSPVVRLWSIAVADKANAWNQHIHHIWEAGLAVYIDGYVRLKCNSIDVLCNRMRAQPEALGGSGVPSVGRSAKRQRADLLNSGGFQGNFCCLSDVALKAIKARNIRLPLGLYRVDSLIGAILSFGLHPEKLGWDRKFIAVADGATWDVDEKSALSLGDIRSSLKRFIRQAQGNLENKAVRHHFKVNKFPPELLPATIAELVITWVEEAHDASQILRFNPLAHYALRNLRKPKDWSECAARRLAC